MWEKLLHKYLKFPYILNEHEYQSPKKPTATIILLHGIGSSLGMWQDVANKLPLSVRVIAVDLLGFGDSPKPTWSTYNAKMQADSIAATLFAKKVVGPLVVVGHSLGALVAVEFAKSYPILTKSLVLVSPPLYQPDRDTKYFNYEPAQILRKMYGLMADNPDDTERILRVAGKYRLINKGFKAEDVNVPAYLATLDAAIINQTSYQDIQKIRRPIHIVSGKLDALVLDTTIKQLAEHYANVTWVSAIGGHEIIGNMQKATNRAIRQATSEALFDPSHKQY